MAAKVQAPDSKTEATEWMTELEQANPQFREAVHKYARSQGVDVYDERVVKYARGLRGRTFTPVETEMPELNLAEESEDFKRTVANYARSQGVDVNDPRVVKYALGLKSRTGDFGDREQDTPIGRRK